MVYVYEIQNNSANQIIYCNGICSNKLKEGERENLDSQIKLLQRCFRNFSIYVFNNPTGLEEYQRATTDEADIAKSFANYISGRATVESKVKVIVHSHGARIAQLALKDLSDDIKKHIEIHSFAGVVMIPRPVGHNYIYENDVIARGGQAKYGEDHIPQHDKPASFADWLYLEAEREIHESKTVEERTEKIKAFTEQFWLNDPSKLPEDLIGRYKKFTQLSITHKPTEESYDITIMPAEKERILEATDESGNITDEMRAYIANTGLRVNQHYHILENFKSALQALKI